MSTVEQQLSEHLNENRVHVVEVTADIEYTGDSK